MTDISFMMATARNDFPIIGLPNIHVLQPTIESLKIQSFKDFEFVLVDGLYHLRPKLFKGEPFREDKLPFLVKHVPIEHNEMFNHRFPMDNRRWNICGSLNTAVIHASGELLVRLDDCSEFSSDYTQRFWDGYQSGYFPCAQHVRFLEGKPAYLNDDYRKRGYESSTSVNYGCKNALEHNRDEILKQIYGEGGLIRDTRYEIVKKEGGRKIAPPEWYYGYSSVSLEAALNVNGWDELFDFDKSLEDSDMGSRLSMAGYKDKFLLDINHQVVEHEHGPISENLIDNNVKPIKCIHPDTIVMLNGYPNKVKDIAKLNNIPKEKRKFYKTITKNGVYKSVANVLQRYHNGEVIKIIPYYTNIPLIVSPEHKIFVSDRYKNKRWVDAKDIETTDYLLYPRLKEINDVKSVKISTHIMMPGIYSYKGYKLADGTWYSWKNQHGIKKIKDDIIINDEFMRLIGYYLGEGSTTFSTTDQINFSFDEQEEDLIVEVIRLMKNIFGVAPTSAVKEKTAFVIRYISTILSPFFDKLFGRSCIQKKLPSWIFGLEDRLIMELIKTLYLSEGVSKDPSSRKNTDRGGYYQFNTSSMTLGYQSRILLNRIGIPVKFWKRDPDPENFSVLPDGREIVPKSTMYYIQIPNEYANVMENITGIEVPIDIENLRNINKDYPFNIVDDDYIYINIREIVKEKYNGELYNLEIEDEDIDGGTYTANGIAVHNCNYAIYLLNKKKNKWRANSDILSKKDVEFIRNESLKSPCSPTPNFYDEDCRGKWFDIWLKNQPIFDLREERKLYEDEDI